MRRADIEDYDDEGQIEREKLLDETGVTTIGDPAEIDFKDFEIEETKFKGGANGQYQNN